MFDDLALSPLTGTILLVVMLLAGRGFRQTWKAKSEGWVWRAWAYGVPAALAFALLAFLPLRGA